MFKSALIAAIMLTTDVEASRLKSRSTTKAQAYSQEYNQAAGPVPGTSTTGDMPQAYSYSGSYTSSYDGSRGYYYYSVQPGT